MAKNFNVLAIWNFYFLCLRSKQRTSEGRVTRREYWSFFLCHSFVMFCLLVVLILELLLPYPWQFSTDLPLPIFSIVLGGVVNLGTYRAWNNITIQRLHDWNQPAHLRFASSVPFLGILLMPFFEEYGSSLLIGYFVVLVLLSFFVGAVLMSVASSQGANKYGLPADGTDGPSGVADILQQSKNRN